MPGRWWQSLRTHFEPAPIADPLWRRALAGCPLARRLDPERQQLLRQLAALFLTRKRFHALAGAVLDDYWRLLIAMQACLPALQQGPASLRGWREVLIYPGEFKVRRSHHDDRTGVITEGDETLIGEAWERGPLVLSLADVQLDLDLSGRVQGATQPSRRPHRGDHRRRRDPDRRSVGARAAGAVAGRRATGPGAAMGWLQRDRARDGAQAGHARWTA